MDESYKTKEIKWLLKFSAPVSAATLSKSLNSHSLAMKSLRSFVLVCSAGITIIIFINPCYLQVHLFFLQILWSLSSILAVESEEIFTLQVYTSVFSCSYLVLNRVKRLKRNLYSFLHFRYIVRSASPINSAAAQNKSRVVGIM